MRRALTSLTLGWLMSASALAQPRHPYLTSDNPAAAQSQTVISQTRGKAIERTGVKAVRGGH